MKRLHRALAVSAAAVSTVALSACSFFSPVQTDVAYNPGDGVPAQKGTVAARNLVLIAEQKGGPANLTGAVLNLGDQEVKVGFLTRIQSEAGQSAELFTVPGRGSVAISGVEFGELAKDDGPGTVTEVVMVTPDGKVLVKVPVQVPGEGPYKTLAPKG